jgi:predicted nuclease with TOPRIM domain
LEQELQALKSAKSVLESEGQAKEKINELLREENAILKEKVQELEETIRRLEDELRSLRDAKEEESKLKHELMEKNKKLSSELSDLNGTFIEPHSLASIFDSMPQDIVSLASRASSQEPLDQEDQLFIQYINFTLKDDIQIAQLLPIGTREVDVSSSCVDGVILWYNHFT